MAGHPRKRDLSRNYGVTRTCCNKDNSCVQARGIVKTIGFTRGVCNFSNFQGFLLDFLENKRSWENQSPQKIGLFWASPFTMHILCTLLKILQSNYSLWAPFLHSITKPRTTPIAILAINLDHGLSFAGEETQTMVWVSFSLKMYSTFEFWRFKFSMVCEFPHFMGMGVVPAPSTLCMRQTLGGLFLWFSTWQSP